MDYNNAESRREWMLSIFSLAGKDNPANKEFQLWKNDNHPIALYSPEVIRQKLEYSHESRKSWICFTTRTLAV